MKKKTKYITPATIVVNLHPESMLAGSLTVKDSSESGTTVTNKNRILSNDREWKNPIWDNGTYE